MTKVQEAKVLPAVHSHLTHVIVSLGLVNGLIDLIGRGLELDYEAAIPDPKSVVAKFYSALVHWEQGMSAVAYEPGWALYDAAGEIKQYARTASGHGGYGDVSGMLGMAIILGGFNPHRIPNLPEFREFLEELQRYYQSRLPFGL